MTAKSDARKVPARRFTPEECRQHYYDAVAAAWRRFQEESAGAVVP